MKAARRELVDREARRQLRAEGYEPLVDPVAELLKLGAEVTALKDVLRRRVAELEDPEWAHKNEKGDEDVKAIVAAYERALDRCERTLGNMLKLDLEARKVRLAEQEGEIIGRVLQLVLGDLGLAENPEVPALVRRRFAEVTV